MRIEQFEVAVFFCKKHGAKFSQCCKEADGINCAPKLSHVVEVLRKTYPVFLPFNYERCYVLIMDGSKEIFPIYKDDSESREEIIMTTSALFYEKDAVDDFLSKQNHDTLLNIIQRVRGTSNYRALKGLSVVRTVDYDMIFNMRTKNPGGLTTSGMDAAFNFTDTQYHGSPSFLRH